MKTTLLIVAVILTFLARFVMAGDLTYPETEKDIVNALTLKDGKVEAGGVEYLSQNGKVYRIIGGKRFRIRGFKDIVDADLAPKAGALIHFDFNSAAIRSESFGLLNEYASALKGGLADAKLKVGGHTDSIGTPEVNMKLSLDRADSVRQHLINHGVAPDRLITAPFGATKPVASNDTDTGRAKNRRVEFVRIE